MRAPRESDVQRAILRWLALVGVFAIRVNSGAVKVGNHYVRANDQPGCSDILAVIPPSGRFAAIEAKRPGGKPTAKQESFLAAVREAGGLGLVVASVADLARQLKAEGYDLESRVS